MKKKVKWEDDYEKKPIVRKVKAWAILRNGKVCETFGRQLWVFSKKTQALNATPLSYTVIPCEITYQVRSKKLK